MSDIGWKVDDHDKKHKKSKHKSKKKDDKKKHLESSSSGSSSDSDSSSDGGKKVRKNRHQEKIKKKELKEAKKAQKKLEKKIKKAAKKGGNCNIPIDLMNNKANAPETREEWLAKQSIIRKVVDPVTGRERLIRGDGEVLEECVSRDRHKEINRQATAGDGNFFQSQTLGWNIPKN